MGGRILQVGLSDGSSREGDVEKEKGSTYYSSSW